MITKEDIIKVLKTIEDPEINIDIWTLELIRDIQINGSEVKIKMTFTTPACPYGPQLLNEIETEIKDIDGVEKVDIELEFSPPWQPPQHVKETLGLT